MSFCCWQLLKSYDIFKPKEIICDIANNKENAGFLATYDRSYLFSLLSGLEIRFYSHALHVGMMESLLSVHVPTFPTAFLCCFLCLESSSALATHSNQIHRSTPDQLKKTGDGIQTVPGFLIPQGIAVFHCQC